MSNDKFPDIRFKGDLRPSQLDVVKIANEQLERGERRLHIVAPPGSGKTILGLYLWACCVKRPALVLSPNSAIQSQWASRLDLFDVPAERASLVSTDPEQVGLLTSLTYQSVTLPGTGDGSWEVRAKALWIEHLIETDHAQGVEEATVWISDLEKHNTDFYNNRLSVYRGKLRERETLSGRALELLHRSSAETLHRLRDANVGMVVLDECHHLMGHWGRVLAEVHEFLGEPVIVGLTATPPDEKGRLSEDVDRYRVFFGGIDYEVPIPAVVRDGFLAPYQDLAYVIRPSEDELRYVANTDDAFFNLVERLCIEELSDETDATSGEAQAETTGRIQDSDEAVPGQGKARDMDDSPIPSEGDSNEVQRPKGRLPAWLFDTLEQLKLPGGKAKDWAAFEKRDPEFSLSARQFLVARNEALPSQVPDVPPPAQNSHDERVEWMTPVLDRYVRHHLRRSSSDNDHELARQITDEMRLLGQQITETGIRACASPISRVLAYSNAKLAAVRNILVREHECLGDRIRAVVITDFEKSSVVAAGIEHLLDEEAGGAVAAFRSILALPETDALDPVLVTGSSVLVDDDLIKPLMERAGKWLIENGYKVELFDRPHDGFHELNGRGADWCPRVYVGLITELFQNGLTRCLVGTRGLLGEGWDASRVNVLIDLTTVTTSMSINQLRGRSIRLDPNDPAKLANNWDVICIAPEFALGLNDYKRFVKKHRALFGVTDDGAIEKGVAHVHPAFASLRPEELEGSESLINQDMLRRVCERARTRKLWKIGTPYQEEPVHAVEARLELNGEGEFPAVGASKVAWSRSSLAQAIGKAILMSMHELGIMDGGYQLHVAERDGGYVRAFLEEAPEEHTRLLAEAIGETLGPLEGARYVIPRFVDRKVATVLSRLLPGFIGRWFEQEEQKLAMWHAVPSKLARKKETVLVFQKHWNEYVSPGEAAFAHRDDTRERLAKATRARQVPTHEVFQKEVFL